MQISRSVFALTFSLFSSIAGAQDSNWNTILYGDRSTLLGGAVIASVDDASAAYYNPGAIADIAPSDFFLATKVFDLTTISLALDDAEARIDTDDLGKAPSFVGGMIPVEMGEHRFAYSVFKRQSFRLRLSETAVEDLGIARSNRLSLLIDASLNDDWFGLSWAYPLFDKTRVGITMFGSYRSHRWYSNRSLEALRDDGKVSTSLITREYSYGYSSLLWKIGVKHQYGDNLVAGLSVTTASLGLEIFSDGDTGASISSTNFINSDGETVEDLFLATYQSSLPATYKSPWTFGAGISYAWRKRSLHVSLEYVGEVAPYDVIDPAPFEGQSSGDSLDVGVVGNSRAILNASLGLEEHLNESLQAFFGFHTDFSVADDDILDDVYITNWDLVHLSGGTQFQFGKAQFTLGLGYAFGGSGTNRFVSLTDVAERRPENFVQRDTKVNFQRFKLIVGFGVRT